MDTTTTPMLDVPAMAEWLKTNPTAVYRLCNQANATGGLPAFKVGRSWRIHLDTLEQWAKARGR